MLLHCNMCQAALLITDAKGDKAWQQESISRKERETTCNDAPLRFRDLVEQGRAGAQHEGWINEEASSTSEPAASPTCRPCEPLSTVGLLMLAQICEDTRMGRELAK